MLPIQTHNDPRQHHPSSGWTIAGKGCLSTQLARVAHKPAHRSLRMFTTIPHHYEKNTEYSARLLIRLLNKRACPTTSSFFASGANRTEEIEGFVSLGIDATGKVTEYPKPHRRNGQTGASDHQTLFDEAWQYAPEASDFEQLTGDTTKLSALRASDRYDIGYTQRAASDSPTVVEAHLILASGTKRPIAETLRIQGQHETREYRFQELTGVEASMEPLKPGRTAQLSCNFSGISSMW